jgi:hypothetical protein
MTTTVPRPAMPPLVTAAPKRWRRWLRLVIPLVVVVLVVIGSIVAYSVQQPDQSDADYLSPVSTAPIGGARLALLVRQRGVTVERVTKTSDALVSAYRGGATLLIPAPALVHPYYLRMLKLMPEGTRIVLVAPTDRTLALGHLPVTVVDQRWAAATDEPGCTLPAAQSAGRAAARRERFSRPDGAAEVHRCYNSGLVELSWHATTLTVVGASDVFRNDRIGEHGNATLAAGLVSGTRRLVWLDLHHLEPRPGLNPGGAPDNAPPSLGTAGSPDPDFPIPGTPDAGQEHGDQGEGGGGSSGGGGGPTLWSAFPPAAWATLVLLLLAGLLLAVARARRLGAPVPEPLPVTVPAAETVLGRGRLYARARARGPALTTLQVAARQRLARLLDLPAGAPREALVAAVAAQAGWAPEGQAGWTPETIESVLYAPPPEDDEHLVAAATNLDTLLRSIRGDLR